MKNGSYLAPPEVALMERIPHHPNVIRLFDHAEFGDFLVLVLERPEPAETLDTFIEEGYLPDGLIQKLAMAKSLFRQILTGLLHCHASGVHHGDLKKDNILVELQTGRAIIIDFGNGKMIFSDHNSCKQKGKSNLSCISPLPLSTFPLSLSSFSFSRSSLPHAFVHSTCSVLVVWVSVCVCVCVCVRECMRVCSCGGDCGVCVRGGGDLD